MGLIYIKNWYPSIIPLLTFLTGSLSVFGLINIGQFIKNKLKCITNLEL